jgi:hypothetical protein
MADPHALHRSLAASGATLMVFVGLCHEAVGSALFPWGPAAFGGPLGWHALGIAGTGVALLVLAGTLDLATVPVVPLAATLGLLGAGIAVYTAVGHGQFHFFAVSLVAGSRE